VQEGGDASGQVVGGVGRCVMARGGATGGGAPDAVRKKLCKAMDDDNGAAVVAVVADWPNLHSCTDRNGDTPLHWAAAGGNKETVAALIGAGAAVAAKDKGGVTPLHAAAGGGNKEAVAALIGAGAAVGAAAKDGKTPLHWAAHSGNKEAVAALIGAGAAVGATAKDGGTPLHWAAVSGNNETVAALIGGGAAVGVTDENGWTPLHAAAGRDRKDTVAALLCEGADVDGDGILSAPLKVAADRGYLQTVRVLVAWGAAVGAVRPSRTRFRLSSDAKQLRSVLDYTPRLSSKERQEAKDEWRAVVDLTQTAAADVDPADRALADLQATFDRFFVNPNGMSVDIIQEVLTPPPNRDVRWHHKAHEVLLFAKRIGVLALDTAANPRECSPNWCRDVYLPVVQVLAGQDAGRAAAVVRDAERNGLIGESNVTTMLGLIQFHVTVYAELANIHRRIDNVEKAVPCTGEMLFKTIEELKGLKQSLHEKEEHDRKVALVKSAVKIGVSLAPVLGGMLSVSVDVVASLTDGLPAAAALRHHVADTTDLAAARQVLQLVLDASSTMSAEQLQQLQVLVFPFPSLEVMDEQLGWAIQELAIYQDVEAAGVSEDVAPVDGRGEEASAVGAGEGVGVNDAGSDTAEDTDDADATSAGGGEDAPSDAAEKDLGIDKAEDKWEDPKDATKSEFIDQLVGAAADARHRRLARRTDKGGAPAAPAASGRSWQSLSRGAAATGVAPWEADVARAVPRSRAVTAVNRPRLGPAARPETAAAAAEPLPGEPDATAAAAAGTTLTPPTDARWGRDFFAGVTRWSARELASHVADYVAAEYEEDEQQALAASILTRAVQHRVTGPAVVRCRRLGQIVACLLGDPPRLCMEEASVESFIAEAQRHAPRK